jgi:hypothetical protein
MLIAPVCCITALGSSSSSCSGQLGDRTPRLIGATEESECDSSPVAGRGGEAGMFCSGEGMQLSQSTGFLAAG